MLVNKSPAIERLHCHASTWLAHPPVERPTRRTEVWAGNGSYGSGGTVWEKLAGTFSTRSGGTVWEKLAGTFSTRKDVEEDRSSDLGVVFVAGSTGRLGERICRELLRSGVRVRAGARNVDKARGNIKHWVASGSLRPSDAGRIEVVAFDLEDSESIKQALNGASRVVCAVGAPEDQVLDSTGPRRIDGEGTINLILTAAEARSVEHFVLVTSLGTGKFGLPAGLLNLFWGVLTWKRKAEEALEMSGMPYTIIRPGGMERPKDDYKNTHNLIFKEKDTAFGGQVSRLQVAELVAAAIQYPTLAANKVLEVVAETTAPKLPFPSLLESIEAENSMGAQAQTVGRLEAAQHAEELAAKELEDAYTALRNAQRKLSALTEKQKAAAAAPKEQVLCYF
ncbi:hypothetical protein CEUSTIGMA_g5105.t1 [Chlamydomonas eustigma]|uniref:NAD(P)-binding domain-containing protein n=1 Tax=Chlamydomonas eustigma TaxID=1157962 RepID=A0A250X437_9CHLO|nr:hypothetical protein CEUSTIGMA_g5105.t1 [Chlamydomonas eustigma]|eukprot:GAX77662.1 hypothetical protein CEUSTIGMA_g5105.t1 [Chlamydomonas eustigma]